MVEVRAACLVGFDLDDYPKPFSEDGEAVQAEVQAAIDAWYERIHGQINHHTLVSFEIEVFCIPMPSVEAFRATLKRQLNSL
jgi:glutamate mutase epsilon subunit